MTLPTQFKKLITVIQTAGGRPMLIGGAVIDTIQERPIKDWDIEVYGVSYSQLLDVLTRAGYPCDLVGKSFGIIKTRAGDIDVDINIPRRENRIGIGHRGFSVELLPNLSPKEAALRRDLTINSMYLDLSSMEIVDPFGGMADLKAGIIRATNPGTFVEDPLRVLRVMQLLPRKGKSVDPQTMALCRSMVNEFPALPAERVFEEWAKLLLKADKPSIGLNFLRESGWIKWFPELSDLIGCPQNPEWHPEGDVWNHTLLVVDNAAQLRDQVPDDWRLAFMFGALLHDVGKPSTTTPELTSPGHDVAGIPLAQNFMTRITREKKLVNKILAIVGNHMRPGQLARDNAKPAAWRRLHNKIRLDVIGLMSKADSAGRPGRSLFGPHKPSEMALTYFEKFGEKPIEHTLKGRHLVAAGYQPGPHFRQMLDKAYQYQIETGCTDIDVLISVATERR